MRQNLLSNILLHNRPVTPFFQVFSTIPSTINIVKKDASHRQPSEKRCIYTYPPLSKDHKGKSGNRNDKKDDENSCKLDSDQTCTPPPPRNPNPFYNYPQICIKEAPAWSTSPKEAPSFCQMPHLPPLPPVSQMPDTTQETESCHAKEDEVKQIEKIPDVVPKESQRPPWPPFGPSPSCCQPSSDQTCTPPPPRNPNPFYNSPQICIKEPPPPPWCTSPKEVPSFCQMPHLPPLPPISQMPEMREKRDSCKAKKHGQQFNIDVFEECDDVLYAGGSDDEYYDRLNDYYEPKYKNTVFYSFTKDSYSNMAVHLSRYHSSGKKGKTSC